MCLVPFLVRTDVSRETSRPAYSMGDIRAALRRRIRDDACGHLAVEGDLRALDLHDEVARGLGHHRHLRAFDKAERFEVMVQIAASAHLRDDARLPALEERERHLMAGGIRRRSCACPSADYLWNACACIDFKCKFETRR